MLAIITLVTFSASSAWAEDNILVQQQQQGNISYVTGGFGKDESDAIRATQANYNLLVMNADKTGHFSGNTRIVISDLRHNPLLDTTSGPLFYANLPKGRYIVEGYLGKQSRKQTIKIATGRSAHVRFVWPEDMSDTLNY